MSCAERIERIKTRKIVYKRDTRFVYLVTSVILLPISICLHLLSMADPVPNLHGVGGSDAMVIMILPPLARIPFALGAAGLVIMALRFRWIRYHDDRIDFVFSAEGIADARPGVGAKVVERVRGSSLVTLSSRSTLTFDLVAADLSMQQALDLAHSYVPALKVTYTPIRK